MNSSIRFWNRSAARYARRPIADQNAYLRKIALTQKYFHPEMDVLEFGCGTGSTALIHAPKVRRYLATDASCVFQTKVATDSRRSLPPIPRESCH